MNTATPTPMPTPEELRDKQAWYQRFGRTEIPLAVYAAIFITMAVLWVIQEVHPDVTLGLLTELMGAAFTLFIIDTLLVRSKAKRWKLVEEHMDYLISRNVNRLRDSVAVRALGFNPSLADGLSETEQLEAIREQRAELLLQMERQRPEQLMSHLYETGLFTDVTYMYMNERADDVWDVLNMKYSEYMAPELVLALIRLHTHIKDLCGHIRQHARAERFPEDSAYYHRIGRMGAGVSVHEILKVVNELKQQGYSEPAALTGSDDTLPAGRGS
jgi:hypothetical protein